MLDMSKVSIVDSELAFTNAQALLTSRSQHPKKGDFRKPLLTGRSGAFNFDTESQNPLMTENAFDIDIEEI